MTRLDSVRMLDAWEQVKFWDEFTFKDLENRLSITKPTPHRWVAKWEEDGKITMHRKIGQTRYFIPVNKLDQVSLDPLDEPPSADGNMWRVMRHLNHFSALDVAAHATAGGIEVTEQRARLYCRDLLKADYLRAIELAQPGKRLARYVLINNTGPRAPKLHRLKTIVDANSGETVVLPGQVRL